MPPSFLDTFLLALGLALFVEGVTYALLAPRIPDLARMLAEFPVGRVRRAGLLAAVAGLAWMALVRWLWLEGGG